MPKGLYLADGSFKHFDPQSLTSEIATRSNAGGLFDGSYGSYLCLLPDPDPILRKRGDEAAVLSDLAADGHVTANILGRKERVLKRDDYKITPGVEDGGEATTAAKLLSDRLNNDLERTTLHNIVAEILDAPFYGMVPLEIMWEPSGDWWHIVDIIPRPFHWFAYNNQNQLIFKGESCVNADPLPFGKFVVARHHPTFKNPYGLRLLSRCLWPITFKRGGTEFYVRFVEKYGVPHTVGKAPAKASKEEKAQMASDLARIVSDAVAVLPHGAEVSFETVAGTTGDIHENFLKRWDKELSKILSGQTLTLEMEGSNSLAASETHANVADDISHADMRIVTTTMNEICWLQAQINNGTHERCPVFSYEDIEDMHSRAKLDKELYSMGVRFTAKHFSNVYKLDEEDFKLLPADQPYPENDETAPPSFAAPTGTQSQTKAGQPFLAELAQKKLDHVIAKMLPEVVDANNDFVKQLENVVGSASSAEELELTLASLLAEMAEPDQVEEILVRAMTAAAVYGAGAVKAEEPKEAKDA